MKPISGLLHVVVYKCGSGFRSICRHCFVCNRTIFGGLSKVFEGHILLCNVLFNSLHAQITSSWASLYAN